MKISENFSLEEFITSPTATKYKIDNTPSQEVKDNIHKLVIDVLQPIRTKLGKSIKVNSGYRCPALNSKVGGAKTSQHLTGAAADISLGSVAANKKLFNFIVEMMNNHEISVRLIIDEFGYKWVHIAINDSTHQKRTNQIVHLTK